MGVSGQRHAPSPLCPRERTPGTHCTGGWVDLRATVEIRLLNETHLDPGQALRFANCFLQEGPPESVLRHRDPCPSCASLGSATPGDGLSKPNIGKRVSESCGCLPLTIPTPDRVGP
jgi:hypothetical protein